MEQLGLGEILGTTQVPHFKERSRETQCLVQASQTLTVGT